MFKRLIAVIMTAALISVCLCACFTAYAAQTDRIKSYIDSIISYKLSFEREGSVQSLIDNVFVKQAGVGAEWYVLSLRQYKYASLDYSTYTSALKNYVLDPSAGNPVEKERCALVLSCLGEGQAYTVDVIENSTGKLGLMSYVYSLHLLNLGFSAKSVTKSSVISAILDRQLSDGGWAVSGSVSDIDSTAMTLQALSQNLNDSKVRAACEKAVSLLSKRSDADNEYSSYGVINSESTAQLIIALSAMGIDCCKDSRFIKDGKTPVDVLLSYKCSDGAYSHTHGDGGTPYPTVQALMAYISYYRLLNSQGSIYKFSVNTKPAQTAPQTTEAPSQSKTTTSKAPSNIGDVIDRFDIFGLLSGEGTTEKKTTTEATTSVTTTASTTVSTTVSISASSAESATASQAETASQGETSSSQTVSESSSYQVFEPQESSLAEETSSCATVQEDDLSQSDKETEGHRAAVIIVAALLLAVGTAIVIYRKKR